MVKVPDCDSGNMGSIPVIRPKKQLLVSFKKKVVDGCVLEKDATM